MADGLGQTGSRYLPAHRSVIMVRFMPDPVSHEEFNTLKRIGILKVKIEETNRSERRWF
jgi:hypothetical protein